MKKFICVFVSLLHFGCLAQRNALFIRDENLNPNGAQNQLELAPSRGTVGHGMYPPESQEPEKYYRMMGSGRKSWVLEHWGNPNEIFWNNGTEYHVYNKRSREAPRYAFQEDRYVKLGYRRDRLVSIEAYFTNCPKGWRGPVYVLPK